VHNALRGGKQGRGRFVDRARHGLRVRRVQQSFDSGPPRPLNLSISEEPGVAPVAVSFASDAPGEVAKPVRPVAARASPLRRAAGWSIDLALVAALVAGHVWLAGSICGETGYWLDLVLRFPLLWASLGGCVALAWSWGFVALCGRTPGMALTGQRLRSLRGDAPSPLLAFARALLSVVSAGLGLFGFLLALFDARGQTLHDKLCRCVAIVD
jgi:resuscitation-promoting factor RpfA